MADLYPLSPSLFLDGYPQVDHALGLSSLPTSAPPQADQGKPGITTGENGKCLQNTFHVLWTPLGPDRLLIQTEMLRSSETWEEVNGQCRTFQNPHSTPAEEGGPQAPQGLPATLTKSSAVTGCPSLSLATTILPSRSFMSARLSVKASTAMISLATAMSNCAWDSKTGPMVS